MIRFHWNVQDGIAFCHNRPPAKVLSHFLIQIQKVTYELPYGKYPE